nr:hypothetical protein [Gemmatimonadota bacterium]NIR78315.1 hypothetical protein [Gemmatimonadota bacterium]NIT90111.1 hypothetical protein [Gemmatimonadota bacterium]NIU30763.1 hypothetical protein [Gemmatimonadota bacterium]NIU35556.1 hypothetical protein [Gemmatimonadota bacterium]
MTVCALAAALWAFQFLDPPPMTVQANPDTVRVGEHVRLVASVPVAGGHTLFFPDTLVRVGPVETRKPARWSVTGVRGDTSYVRVTYTLAVYRPGVTHLPPIPVVIRNRPPGDETRAERLDGGGFVGQWADLPRVPDFSFVRTAIEGPVIYTAPTLL